MGGSISLIIREPDGTTHKRVSWTNCLPGFVNDLKIVNKDVDYVRNYLRVHCDGYERQYKEKDKGGPVSYGIVVIDMQKDHILHSQGYTSNIGRYYRFDMFGNLRDGANTEWRKKLAAFFKVGKVIGARTHGAYNRAAGGYSIKPTIVKVKTLKRLDRITIEREEAYENSRAEEPLRSGLTINGRRTVRTGQGDETLYAKTVNEAVLDMSPFKVIRYAEGRGGLIAVFKKMLELGFDITAKDRAAWSKHFEESEYKPYNFDMLTEFTKKVFKAGGLIGPPPFYSEENHALRRHRHRGQAGDPGQGACSAAARPRISREGRQQGGPPDRDRLDHEGRRPGLDEVRASGRRG